MSYADEYQNLASVCTEIDFGYDDFDYGEDYLDGNFFECKCNSNPHIPLSSKIVDSCSNLKDANIFCNIFEGYASFTNSSDKFLKKARDCVRVLTSCIQQFQVKRKTDKINCITNIPDENFYFFEHVPKCRDKSDFIYEKTTLCDKSYMISCHDNEYCIHKDMFCDGHVQCPDESDEETEICQKCPREFGYPSGKSKFASLLCKHRYTNISICAVPCDGTDDLCQDYLDEQNCQISSTQYTMFVLSILICLTIAIGEITFWLEKTSKINVTVKSFERTDDQNKKYALVNLKSLEEIIQMLEGNCSFNRLTSLIHIVELLDKKSKNKLLQNVLLSELKLHSQNIYNTCLCLKKNLGINESSQKFLKSFHAKSFFSRLNSSLKIYFCKKWHQQFMRRRQKNVLFSILCILKYQMTAIIQIVFYYLDLIKDTYLLLLLYQNVSITSDFFSFVFQMFFFTSASIILPQMINFLFLLHKISSKQIHFVPGALMSIFFFLSPATAIYVVNRSTGSKEMEKCKTEPIDQHKYVRFVAFQNQINKWNTISAVLKTNEILFENTVQVTLLLMVIFMKFSNSSTIIGLEDLFLGNEIEYVTLSAIWSLISIIFGQIKWQVMLKNNCMPFKAKILLFIYFVVSLITRLLSVMIYFAPSFGFLNILNHWKFGVMKPTQDEIIYDLFKNGTKIYFTDQWKALDEYTDLTIWRLEKYFMAFLVAIIFHYIVIFMAKYFFALKFKTRASVFAKFYHILNQITCPTSYKDWDEEIKTMDDVRENWRQVSLEMKVLLALFAIEHLVMCIPIWILSYNIYNRNLFLDEFFPQLPEEQWSTTLAYAMSIICPILFLIVPFIQYGLFLVYHKYGHPWSVIFNGQFEEQKDMEEHDTNETFHNDDYLGEVENIEMTELIREATNNDNELIKEGIESVDQYGITKETDVSEEMQKLIENDKQKSGDENVGLKKRHHKEENADVKSTIEVEIHEI